VIEETIKRPLTDELLFGALENGGTATVDVEGGELVVRYPEPLKEAAAG
jgi:ATP-dependent Clp protease ATP-binding subunit ClpA